MTLKMKRTLCFLSILFSTQICYSQIPFWLPANGLAAYYPFSGNTLDSSGNNNNGINSNAVLTTDRFGAAGKAYRFNGINSFINIPASASLDIRRSITTSAWIKLSPNASGNAAQIIWRGDLPAQNDPYSLAYSNGQVIFRRDHIGTSIVSGSSLGQLDTNFHSVIGTYDSLLSKYTFYFDGTVIDTLTMAGEITYPTSQMWNMIGAVDYGTSQNFHGTIDDIAIYNRALPQCEIKNLYFQNAIKINTQPQNISAITGNNTQFTVTTTGLNLNYQWQLNSGTGFNNLSNAGPYTGVNTNTLTISNVNLSMNNYIFRCLITSGSLCPITTGTAVLSVLTDISELEKKNISYLFPNPASKQLTILHPTFPKNTDYSIYDVKGIVVSKGEFENKQTIINVAELPDGNYLIKFKGKSLRFTKQ
jgi:hypothetical protein